MILKRAKDRYDEIRSAEKRIAHLHGSDRDDGIARIQEQRYKMVSAEIGRNLLERAYGHSQTIAILHDIDMEGETDGVDHVMIDAQAGEILIISTRHISSIIIQKPGNKWHANYGKDHYEIEDPRRRLRRQISWAQQLFGNAYGILGVALLPPDVQCEPNENRWIHLIRSDRFEAFMSERRAAHNADQQPRINHDEMLRLADRLQHHSPTGRLGADDPEIEYLATQYGTIRIRRLASGDYAVRNQNNPELIEIVRSLIRGQGRWNPKYHNWEVTTEVVEKIRRHFSGQ